jgi:hypothetical protein
VAYTKFVTDAVAIAGVCTLTLINEELNDYYVGDKVRVNGINNNFNGVHTLTAVDQVNLTITYSKGSFTQTLNDIRGAEVEVLPQWTDEAAVISWLGIESATTNDTDFISVCVEGANEWCYRKRQEAGYTMDRTTFVPSGDVALAATMYAATLYRERGTSGDSYGSYDGFSAQPQPVTLARIMQLLGCPRARVA